MKVQNAAIIAGGASRRMGTNKALLAVDGQPLVARVADVLRKVLPQVIVVTSDPAVATAAGAVAVADIFPGKGPLAGIHAALFHTQSPTFCCACDMPYLNAEFIGFLCARLADYDAVLPHGAASSEPLHTVYAPSCLPSLERQLQRERVGPIESALTNLKVLHIEADAARRFDARLRMFENWNRPEDVARTS